MTNQLKSRKFHLSHIPHLLKETFREWKEDDPWRMSAIIAYYALLSLPAFLIIIIRTVGAVWGQEIVQGRLTSEISSALGHDAAESIEGIIQSAQADNTSIVSAVIGAGVLIFGATGIFYQLQLSLNAIWDIKIDPEAGWKKLILDRARSFGFVLIIGFLLLISFILTAFISFFNEYIGQIFGELVVYFSFLTDIILSVGIITVLFALIFRYLPDAEIQWKTVWVGGLITAILFVLGKYLLGLYFGKADPGSTYGAAGTIILVMLWVSYSSLILFFGAEFTFVYAKHYGIKISPNSNAVRIKEKIVAIENGSDNIPPEDP